MNLWIRYHSSVTEGKDSVKTTIPYWPPIVLHRFVSINVKHITEEKIHLDAYKISLSCILPESKTYYTLKKIILTTSIAKRLLSSQMSGEIACPMSVRSSASSSRTLIIISRLPRYRNRRKARGKKVTQFSDNLLDPLARHDPKVLFPHIWHF